MRQEVVSKVEEIAQRVAASDGIEVVEVELKGGGSNQFLRISIDKPEGVTHADCEMVSQQVGTILDVEDVVPGEEIDGVAEDVSRERRILDFELRAPGEGFRCRTACAARAEAL